LAIFPRGDLQVRLGGEQDAGSSTLNGVTTHWRKAPGRLGTNGAGAQRTYQPEVWQSFVW